MLTGPLQSADADVSGFDLATMREYAAAVAKETDAFLASPRGGAGARSGDADGHDADGAVRLVAALRGQRRRRHGTQKGGSAGDQQGGRRRSG